MAPLYIAQLTTFNQSQSTTPAPENEPLPIDELSNLPSLLSHEVIKDDPLARPRYALKEHAKILSSIHEFTKQLKIAMQARLAQSNNLNTSIRQFYLVWSPFIVNPSQIANATQSLTESVEVIKKLNVLHNSTDGVRRCSKYHRTCETLVISINLGTYRPSYETNLPGAESTGGFRAIFPSSRQFLRRNN